MRSGEREQTGLAAAVADFRPPPPLPKRKGFLRKTFDMVGYGIGGLVLIAIFMSGGNKQDTTSQPIAHSMTQEPVQLPAETLRRLELAGAGATALRQCVRVAFAASYPAGIYGLSQMQRFVEDRCYAQFRASMQATALMDDELTEMSFRFIVGQEATAISAGK